MTKTMAEDPESGTSFLHDDREKLSGEEYRKATCTSWTYWRPISRFLPYILAIVAIVEALAFFHIFHGDVQNKNLLPSQSLFSKVPKKIVVFNPDESYNDDPFGPDGVTSAWNNLIPQGKGHIRVEDPAALKLSGGLPLEDIAHARAEEYTISLFHQLHCLAAIKSRVSLLQAWYGGETDKEYLTFAINDEHVSAEHIYHCFDYIRQAIMCNGDTTLERMRKVDGKLVQGVDGWGVEHECRDYEAIYAYAEAHRSRNITGI